ncbi:MAG: HEAT repeat domain-containing protein [Turicibacter sp.]
MNTHYTGAIILKSSLDVLQKRGYFTSEDLIVFQQYFHDDLIFFVSSTIAMERCMAIYLLGHQIQTDDLDFVQLLLKRLAVENCLYPKIEICKVLEKGGLKTATLMINELGCIGKNQHKIVPATISKKSSYPLPRDIIARTLAHMDISILPVLLEVLKSADEVKISEVIDAIGFLLFYHPASVQDDCFVAIVNTCHHYKDNDLIVWKCAQCLAAFKTDDSISVLTALRHSTNHMTIKKEAIRSLDLIYKNDER